MTRGSTVAAVTDFVELGRAAHARMLRRTPSLDEDLLEALGPSAEDLVGPMRDWLRGWDSRQAVEPYADWERSSRVQQRLHGADWLSPADFAAGRGLYSRQRDAAEDPWFGQLPLAERESWARKAREKAVQGP